VVANIAFRGGKFSRLEMVPINVNNFEVDFQPRLLSGEQAQAVQAELAELSASVRLVSHNGLIVFEPAQSEQAGARISDSH
jgi:hypothetical protein